MKKLAGLIFFTVLLILSVTLVLFSGPAQAYVYDDFTSPGVNTSLWVDRGPNTGLFSQPGNGYLYFNDSIGGQTDRLRSYNQMHGAFSVLMQYSNFQAINNQQPGQGAASAVELELRDGSNWYHIIEGKNAIGQFFRAEYYLNGTWTWLKYFYTGNVNSGGLGIRYNGILGAGGKVDFLYNIGVGWVVIDSCAPNFSQAPYFDIAGYDTNGQSLSFQVDQIQVITPNPSPTINLLLEPDS